MLSKLKEMKTNLTSYMLVLVYFRREFTVLKFIIITEDLRVVINAFFVINRKL